MRISLSEIAHILMRPEQVSNAVCLAAADGDAIRIVAFVEADTPLSPADLRQLVLSQLPSSMTPDTFHVLAALPMARSGKVDRGALLASAGLAG